MNNICFNNIKISGIATAVPSNVIDNNKYKDIFGEKTVNDFISVTGIATHHKSVRKQVASDLGYIAAERIISRKGISKEEVGAIINVTQTPDYCEPSSAYVLHKRLELPESCISFDINLGCSGYVYGIYLAGTILQSIQSKYALLIVGDVKKYPDVEKRNHPDPSNLMMFGDSGSATILERTDVAPEMKCRLFSRGKDYHMLYKIGENRCLDAEKDIFTTKKGVNYSLYDNYMDGMGVFSFSTSLVPKSLKQFLADNEIDISMYDYYFMHQANKMIIDRIAKKMDMPSEKVPISLDRFGNTSSASIPVTIVSELGEIKINKRNRVLLCGFGVGLSWGMISTEIESNDVLELIVSDDYYEFGEDVYKSSYRD